MVRELRIINRPEEIEARLVPGHRGGDLIKGAFNRSSVGTLVERKTRFFVLCRIHGKGADPALYSFTRQMNRLPAALRKSMTWDRGSEMACHPKLAGRLRIDIWLGRSARTPLGRFLCNRLPGSAARTRTPAAFGATIDPPDQFLVA